MLAVAALLGMTSANAQGILVTKTDGSQQQFKTSAIEQMWLEGYDGNGSTKGLAVKSNGEKVFFGADELEKISFFGYESLNISETPAEAVDLGLPSGRKWASYNIGATKPQEYGSYLAWGELLTKSSYDWPTYKFSGDTRNTLNKYNTNSSWGIVDNLTILTPDDDVAHRRWRGAWRIPTHEEQIELVFNCKAEPETIDGVEGIRLTGPNGNSIFLPKGGLEQYSYIGQKNSWGYYWSSSVSYKTPANSLNCDYDAYIIQIYKSGKNDIITAYSSSNRCFGISVRPVRDDLTISQGDTNMKIGEVLKFQILTGSGHYSVESSNTAVVSAALDGTTVTLTGMGDGESTITVSDTEYDQAVSFIIVIIPATSGTPADAGPIDLGLPSGTRWSTMNVGATAIEQTGIYVAWGELEPRTNYNTCNYDGTLADIAGSDYDVAKKLWGDNWRMPTREQLQELKDKCSKTKDVVNGINGIWFVGPNGNKIFFPYTHYIWLSGNGENTTHDLGVWGTAYIWSSTSDAADSSTSYGMKFGYMDFNNPEKFKRMYGMPVRAVMP